MVEKTVRVGGVAVARVVGAHLVPAGEHLAAAPAGELPGLVDILEVPLHVGGVLKPLAAL